MSIRLKERNKVPPTGFAFQQPETGAKLDGQSLEETVALVVKHRIANALPRQSVDEVREDVEAQLCMLLGPSWCQDAQAFNFPTDWESIKAGTRTLLSWAFEAAKGGHPYVTQEEAERRASACSNCFMNKRGGGCLSCGFVDLVRKVMAETPDPGQTKNDDKLNTCTICGCLLRKKVWLRAELIKSTPEQKAAYAALPWCWLRE